MRVYNKRHNDAPSDAIYVGRGSDFGNEWSHMKGTRAMYSTSTREEAILSFDLWLNSEPNMVEKVKTELKGKSLVCYCSPEPCHAEVLMRVANDESRWWRNWFSNMLPFETPLVRHGIEYNSVENYYQAMKIPKDDIDKRREFAKMTPQQAKIASRKLTIDPDYWTEEVKMESMEYALWHKFAKGTEWRRKLDLTHWELVEWNNWGDVFWGRELGTNKGRNELGKLLMKIRDKSLIERIFE